MKYFVLVSCGALAGAVAWGCSSSSPANDSGDAGIGAHLEAGTADQQAPASRDSGATPPAPGDDGGTGPGPDAGPTCKPADESAFQPPAYVHAAAHQSSCTAAQITAYTTACWSSTATVATCKSFTGAAANKACLTCAETPDTASSYGPLLILANQEIWPNTAGCVELKDPTNGLGCATAVQADMKCSVQACSACAINDLASAKAWGTCVTATTTTGSGTCDAVDSKAGTACGGEVDAGAGPSCLFTTTEAEITGLLTIFCGP